MMEPFRPLIVDSAVAAPEHRMVIPSDFIQVAGYGHPETAGPDGILSRVQTAHGYDGDRSAVRLPRTVGIRDALNPRER